MSSSYVRTEIKTFLSANSTENVVDLTGQYLQLNEMLTAEGLTRNDPWLGIQFIGSTETPQSLVSTNNQGRYREIGSLFFHVVARVSNTLRDDILARAETLRNSIRGRRINDIVIEGVTPPNFEQGATLDLEGGYSSASVIVNYYRDLNL